MGASDSKLAFKQSIFGLAGRDDIPHGDALWQEFYGLPESAEDVFSLWSPSDVGCLTLSNKDNRPPQDVQVQPKKNLETLIYILVARMKTLQGGHVYNDNQQQINKEMLNCIRILTRLLPFVYEAQHIREWHDHFFWRPRKPAYFWDHKKDKPGPLFDGLDFTRRYELEDFDLEIDKPLGETLLDVCVRNLFFAGFTIPKRTDADGKPDLEFTVKVWQTGIGNSRSLGCSREHEKNQYEVVRLLLTIMSTAMYMLPNEIATTEIKPLTFMTTKLEKRLVNGIVCSLLNTVLKYNPNTWSVPIEMATGSSDFKRTLVTNCLQLVLVLMVYEPPSPLFNQFRQSMSSLHRPDDFQFVQTGMTQVLAQPVSGTFNYPLTKEKALPWAPEMVSFLWELVQCNRRFRRYLIDTSCALDYVILVLYYALDSKDDPSKHGILRMCVLFLQTMSTEERFVEKLNHPFRHPETLPAIIRIQNFHGSYSDFLICSIHTIFMTMKNRLETSLYPALVAVVKNISPYQHHLARATSGKLINMMEILASPGFLLENDSNHVLLKDLLEAINSILENNLAENRRFVEALVSSRHRFKTLREFTVESALAEMDRLSQERKDRGDSASLRSPISRTTSFESVRGPVAVSARSSSLRDVLEDDRFAIGEDGEDDGDDGNDGNDGNGGEPNHSISSTSFAAVQDSTSRNLSEKARGKQPAAIVTSLAPSSPSRNPSIASLPTPHATISMQGQPFRPTQDWLEGWYPQLPLEKIFDTIQLAETKQLHFTEASTSTARSAGIANTSSSMASTVDVWDGIESRDERTPTGARTAMPIRAPAVAFHWTPLAIGWYTALLWSRIYLSETEIFQGSGGLYSSTSILLFRRGAVGREISLRSPKGAIDAVGDGIVKRISSMSKATVSSIPPK